MLKNLLIILLIGLISGNALATTVAHYHSMLQPEEAKKDVEQWLAFIDKTHPDLAYTVKDVPLFYQQVNEFKNSLNKPISVRDFWLAMMVFNHTLSDGHSSLSPPNRKVFVNDYLESGGTLFPYEVILNNGQLIIKAKLTGEASDLAGSVIDKINGVPINAVLAPLLKRMHGDSDNQRKAMLSTRFATYYWLYFGEHKQFKLTVSNAKNEVSEVMVSSGSEISYDDSFESNFKFTQLNKDTGLLTINTFLWLEDEARVINFFKSVFTEIKKLNLKHLLIDIRKNSGGDDHFWKKGILPYIADKSWRTGSNYQLKVIAGRVGEGQKVGDVVKGEISTVQTAELDNPLKFTGDVSVLVGAYTYSSSILFMNTIQDYEFGKLVGDKTGGKSGQTGGIQTLSLTHSKLLAVIPRFWLTRPKGGHNLELVTLDTVINYDPLQPNQLIDKLLNSYN